MLGLLRMHGPSSIRIQRLRRDKIFLSQKIIRNNAKTYLYQQGSIEDTRSSLLSIFPKKLIWITQTLQGAHEQVEAPKYYFQVSHPTKKFPTYVSLMSYLIDTYFYFFYKENVDQVWQGSMIEEHEFILNNDVWEVSPRYVEKSMIDFRRLFKVKHMAIGNMEKYKDKYMVR